MVNRSVDQISVISPNKFGYANKPPERISNSLELISEIVSSLTAANDVAGNLVYSNNGSADPISPGLVVVSRIYKKSGTQMNTLSRYQGAKQCG